MDPLKKFYDDKFVSAAVETFFTETLKDLALEQLFQGNEARDIAAAKKVVETVFSKLKEQYEPLKEASVNNQAR